MAGQAYPVTTRQLQGGAGGYQVINGQTYAMYSPEWYDAMRAAQVRTAGTEGTAAGTKAKSALEAFSGASAGGGGALSGLRSAVSGLGGTGTGTGGTGGLSRVAPIAPIDTSGAQAAAFSRAKDVTGKTARASLNALRDELGATGMLGGGAEVQGVRDIIQSGQGALGDVTREQAIQQAALGQRTAEQNYQGAITQRGQDINLQEAQARLAQAQNQAEWQRQMELLRLAFSGLNSAASGALY